MITLPWFGPLLWAIFILALIWFLSVIGPFFFGAPWVPMPVAQARRMLQLANVQPGETVYDLGSGDGRVLILAAREFQTTGVGIEIEPLRAWLSQLSLILAGVKSQVKIWRANYFNVSLADADVVVIYLLPQTLIRLAPKLRAELKPGARVVTLTYHFLEWQAIVEEPNIRVYQPNKESSTKAH